MTEFQVAGFHDNLFPGYIGIPILVPRKITGNFPSKFSVPGIHRKFDSHINVHTITVIHDSVFFTQIFL